MLKAIVGVLLCQPPYQQPKTPKTIFVESESLVGQEQANIFRLFCPYKTRGLKSS